MEAKITCRGKKIHSHTLTLLIIFSAHRPSTTSVVVVSIVCMRSNNLFSISILQHLDGRLDPRGVDILSKLLQPDPQRRPTAAEALQHPYFDMLRNA
jgi:serine/threonine protein kinase